MLSRASERRLPRALGEVGVDAGEQGRDGPPLSAMMVEPEKGGMGHSAISLIERTSVPTPTVGPHACL